MFYKHLAIKFRQNCKNYGILNNFFPEYRFESFFLSNGLSLRTDINEIPIICILPSAVITIDNSNSN